jgi:quercetin dioxygenase-like cupin family protein
MTVAHESSAPILRTPEPHRRTLAVLLSPLLQAGVSGIAAGLTIVPPGGQSDEHHHDEGEFFYVVEGPGIMKHGKERLALTAGTAVWCPPHDPHQLINEAAEVLKVLWVLVPPGREAGILEAAQPAKGGKA